MTIEQTKKTWLAMQLTGGVIAVEGVPVVMLGSLVGVSAHIVGVVMVIGGLCLFMYGQIMAWWHHG